MGSRPVADGVRHAREATAGPRAQAGLVALLTLATLELIRLSGPLLDTVYGSAGVPAVALVAALAYAASGPIAALLLTGTRRSPRRAALTGTALLGGLRLLVQATEGETRVVAGLAAVAVALAVLTLAVETLARSQGGGPTAAGAICAGAAGSVGLQLALGTWDAPWRQTALGWAVAVVLVAGLVLLAALAGTDAQPPPSRARWVLGPVLAITVTMLANPAFAAAQSGLPLLAAGVVQGLGLLLAAVLSARDASARRLVTVLGVLGVVGGVAVALMAPGGRTGLTGPLVLVALLIAQLGLGATLAAAWSAGRQRRLTGRWIATPTVVGLTAIGPVLVQQLTYEVPLGFPNDLVLVAAAAAVAIGGLRWQPTQQPTQPLGPARASALPVLAATTLLLGAVAGTGGWANNRATAASPPTGRVVSWNLHYGVTGAGAVDLEAVARAIEAHDPDVVLLQEVSRGWVQGGGVDMASWLGQRLDRRMAFGPAADGRFGNVILARDELIDVRVQSLPYGAGPQRRSALTAVTRVGGQALTVTSLHLQHRAGNGPTRVAQSRAFLAAATATPQLVGGDLNAGPGTPEVLLFPAAGFVSAIDAVGDPSTLTNPSSSPTRRIDWVWSRGVRFTSAQALAGVRLSDHLPIVVTVGP